MLHLFRGYSKEIGKESRPIDLKPETSLGRGANAVANIPDKICHGGPVPRLYTRIIYDNAR